MATPRAGLSASVESALWSSILAAMPNEGPSHTNGVTSGWVWSLVQHPPEAGDWVLQRMVEAGVLQRIDGAGGPWWRKVVGAIVPAPVDQFGGLSNGAVLRVIDGAKNVEGQMPVTVSSGVADAGRIPQLDAAGKLDASLVADTFATDADVAAAVAAHEAAGDPHPDYATDGDVGVVSGALASHIAATNPHSGAQPLDATLTALAALTTAADRLAYFTGVDTAAVTAFTAAARTFMAAVDAAAQRAALGLTPAGGLEQAGSNVQIANDGVTNAKLRNSAALSVIGRSANSVGDPADIPGAADGVLRVSTDGTSLGFGQIVPSAIGSVTSARLLGRTTAGTGSAEQITVGSNLTLSSGDLRFSWWKPQSIMLNPTGDTAAPVTIDVADAAGMVDAVIGSTWAFPCIRLADGAWVFVIL